VEDPHRYPFWKLLHSSCCLWSSFSGRGTFTNLFSSALESPPLTDSGTILSGHEGLSVVPTAFDVFVTRNLELER